MRLRVPATLYLVRAAFYPFVGTRRFLSPRRRIRRRRRTAALVATLVGLAQFDVQAAAPYVVPSAKKQYEQIIRSPAASYSVQMGGTLDEFNTAYYPVGPAGYTRLESRFQPNSFLMIENQGTMRLENARLTINGRRDWSSVDAILGSIFKPGMTDAERALAIFHHTASIGVQTHDNNLRVGPDMPALPGRPANEFHELADPVKAANVYYANGCATAASNFVILSRHAGMDARVVWVSPTNHMKTHAVAEVFYDGKWHLFDPDSRTYFLEEDRRTVASYKTLHDRPWLVDAMHTGGFASPGLISNFAQEYAKHWPPPEMPVDTNWVSSIELDLRPREKFIWRWTDDDKFRVGDNPRNRGIEPPLLANGKLVYEPRLDAASRAAEAASESLLRQRSTSASGDVVLMPHGANQLSTLVYEVTSPYPIVGGTIGGQFQKFLPSDQVRLSVSTDGKQWHTVLDAGTGNQSRYASIDHVLPPKTGRAVYRYYVKAEMRGGSKTHLPTLTGLYFETDVQMAENSLPSLSVGKNQIVFQSDSGGPQQVRVVHGWQESSATTPPPAPDSLRIRGGIDSLRLTWNQRPDANRDPIVDYHVQVSGDTDTWFPVNPNFDRLLFGAQTEWSIPGGAFRPLEDYYFRVRSRDRWGAWSIWSDPLEFIYDPFASRDGQRVIGDSNLDGQFTSADLVLVFQRGEYEDGIRGNSIWTDGDWNGDGDFDSADIVALFLSGQWNSSNLGQWSASNLSQLTGSTLSQWTSNTRSMRAMSIPEPAGMTLALIAVTLSCRVRKRRSVALSALNGRG